MLGTLWPLASWMLVLPLRQAAGQTDGKKGLASFWRRVLAFKDSWQESLAVAQPPPGLGSGPPRGVVIVGGRRGDPQLQGDHAQKADLENSTSRAYYTLDALLVLAALRRTGCALPVELWHDHDEGVLGVPAAWARAAGVTFRNFREVDGALFRAGWQFKTAAVLHSQFNEVLFLDADNFPLTDPTALFEAPEYVRTGAMFWPDHDTIFDESPMWAVIGRTPTTDVGTDSAQMLLNRTRHWLPIALADHFNDNGPEFYYHFLHGDKETWRYAFLALRRPFSIVPLMANGVGYTTEGTFCGHTFLQHHPIRDGEVLFVHRAMRKLSAFLQDQELRWTALKPWPRGRTPPDGRGRSSTACQCQGGGVCFELESEVSDAPAAEQLLQRLRVLERDLLAVRAVLAVPTTWPPRLRPRWWASWLRAMEALVQLSTPEERPIHELAVPWEPLLAAKRSP